MQFSCAICSEKLNIELLLLPSYSPNLNIMERLWKWKKRVFKLQIL
ncbi:MAG: transposase [Prevotellaceae bacterium]|nr:transposase [Prevotellaceae bacterium]